MTERRPTRRTRLTFWRRIQMFFEQRILCPTSAVVSFVWTRTLGPYVYIKQTRMVYEESANMRFVRRATSVPVPRVYAAFRVPLWMFWWRRGWTWGKTTRYPDTAFIFMERVVGESLDIQTWLSLEDHVQDRIISQLRNYISQLRSLKPPPGTLIGSVSGRPVADDRLAQGWPTDEESEVSGPYADEAELNLALRRQHDVSEFPPTVAESHSRSHPLVFTHGDIDLRNVMVKDNNVVALIDWEASGWFPAHWEYLKAHWVPTVHEKEHEWRDRIKEIVTPYEMERAADKDVVHHVIDELRWH